ncbi:hypothetical protein ACFVJ5_30650 [Nocardia sp. NPDC127606]|uniref:hypothetical protein n=1 Tax=Nocardia sp. NPDC127606 TaxID=3345406 RepID=UPI003645A7FA
MSNAGYEAVTHHYVGVRLDGEHRLVQYWPDASPDLLPVDADVVAASKEWAQLDKVERHELQLARDTWHLGSPDEAMAAWGLYTYVELSEEEEAAVARGELDIRAVFDARVTYARSVVEAITTQTNRYFDVELPQLLKERIAYKRRLLTNRAAVSATLTFDDEWTLAAPTLESIPTTSEQPTADAVAGPGPGEATVEHRDRLDPKSFADVQQVIRLWANGIERYPVTFYPLGEDRLSDHLAVTLNASLANSKREVYSRRGKSDIFIQADVLAEGSGPEKIFICEAKIASDDTVVTEAVDPQLFSYLNTHDTAAVLLLYFKQKEFDGPRERRLAALRRVEGYVDEAIGPSGWPVFEYQVGERHVRLCIASVHIPRVS